MKRNLKMSIFIWTAVLTLCVPALPVNSAARTGAKFSSVYTDTKKDCRSIAEELFACKGYGGYRLKLSYHGLFAGARIEATKSGYALDLAAMQSLGWQPKVEWRLADGKPFAVIVRVDERETTDEENPKKIGEWLVVKGLAGFEDIDKAVDAKNAKANEEARRVADEAYAEIKARRKSVKQASKTAKPNYPAGSLSQAINGEKNRGKFLQLNFKQRGER